MPYDALIVGPGPALPLELQRVVGAVAEEEHVTLQAADGGGALAVCRDGGAFVVSVYAPMYAEVDDELRRIYPSIADGLDLPCYLSEVLIAVDELELGERLATALAEGVGARLVPLVPPDPS